MIRWTTVGGYKGGAKPSKKESFAKRFDARWGNGGECDVFPEEDGYPEFSRYSKYH